MIRRAATLVALALAAAPATATACQVRAAPDPRVPTWERVNGFALGARAATGDEIERYLGAVDAASDRVRTREVVRTLEGRPITLAVIGRPAAIAPRALDALAGRIRALREGEPSSRGAAERLAGRAPAFAWIGGSVHGNEPSGGDADMQLLYDLAAGRDCATGRIRERLVTFLLPIQNPDGRAAGRRSNAAGFDLNRDWFARTQPETDAKVRLMARYPPLLFVDQHEQDGTSFFVPPNADPVHHEISSQALDAIGRVLTPPVRRAFAARRLDVTSDATYDLFFMGFGDTVTTTLFGAAGMTFEKGSQSSYPERTAEHLLAARTVLAAAARGKAVLVRRWAAQWRAARRQGVRGLRQANRLLHPAGRTISRPVPDAPVHAYVLRADRRGADAARLVDRLTSVGVIVEQLTAPLAVAGLRRFGERRAAPATLPAGTYVVPMAQGAKHWVEALLGDEAYAPFPYFYDVSAWSNPLLMGLDGGALGARLPADAPRRRVASAVVTAPDAGAGAYLFAGDAQGSAELAVALLTRGVAVRRLPADGSFAAASVPAPEALAARVAVREADAIPAAAVALRLPRVALLAASGAQPEAGPAELSPAWARYVLERRLGLVVDRLGDSEITAGRLAAGGYDAFVVPDGTTNSGGLSPAALAALAAWVRSGGRLLAWRGQGIEVARAAGLTAVRALRPEGLRVPGAALRIAVDSADPVAWGEQPRSFALDVDDPVLDAGPAPVVARYPAGAGFWASGSLVGAAALAGTAAVTHERAGSGDVVLFSFDPCSRGYAEGTMRLLANALLMPSQRG